MRVSGRKRRREACNINIYINIAGPSYTTAERQRPALAPGTVEVVSLDDDEPPSTLDVSDDIVEFVRHVKVPIARKSKPWQGRSDDISDDEDEDDEVAEVATKCVVHALIDYPHPRPFCAVHKFTTSPLLLCEMRKTCGRMHKLEHARARSYEENSPTTLPQIKRTFLLSSKTTSSQLENGHAYCGTDKFLEQ